MAVEDGRRLKALGLQRKAAAVLREAGAASELVASLTCIAVLEGKLGNTAASLTGFEDALVIQRPFGDPSRLATLLGNVAASRCGPEIRRRPPLCPQAAEQVPLWSPACRTSRRPAPGRSGRRSTPPGTRRAEGEAAEDVFSSRAGAGALLGARESGRLREAVVPPICAARTTWRARRRPARRRPARRSLWATRPGVAARKAWTRRASRAGRWPTASAGGGATTDALYPKPSALAEVLASLAPDQALLSYAWGAEYALCFVVTAKSAAPVDLGPGTAIETLCAAVAAAPEGRVPADAVARLKTLLVDALHLPAETKRLLVTPHGSLAYVPFALLAPDREAVLVPSGTTWMLLRADTARRGAKVLALGDPAYGTASRTPAEARLRSGFTLSPLPATRDEAKAVGSTVLLGADASEARLRKALEGAPRWRAVHFACHGLVDPERPRSPRSPSPRAVGRRFLTARRSSACVCRPTCRALGVRDGPRRVYAAEGIVGLTRAFIAVRPRGRELSEGGRPRDEPLMTRFYKALQGKDVKAAAALRRAQEEVRTFEEETLDVEASRAAGRDVRVKRRPFEDPAAWAGWVLWGLAD
jgi:hypothetical protein